LINFLRINYMINTFNKFNFHVVYAVTGLGNDKFSSMTRISILSLRHFNSSCRVTVALDSDSLVKLSVKKDPLLNEADNVIEISTPNGDAQFRNRFVKTSLGFRVEGPFLFMDSDTLVRSEISEIFTPNADIKGSLNHSQRNTSWQVNDKDTDTLALMEWKHWHGKYINGGLIYYSGSGCSQQFGRLWHSNWLDSYKRTGSSKDQPALNATLAMLNPSFDLLPFTFNAQIKYNTLAAYDASIWHYYSSYNSPPITHVEAMVDQISLGFILNKEDVIHISQMETPWLRCESIIGKWFLKSLKAETYIQPYTLKYLEGYYLKSLILFIREMYPIFRSKVKYHFKKIVRINF
jgi:hypothetical protein